MATPGLLNTVRYLFGAPLHLSPPCSLYNCTVQCSMKCSLHNTANSPLYTVKCIHRTVHKVYSAHCTVRVHCSVSRPAGSHPPSKVCTSGLNKVEQKTHNKLNVQNLSTLLNLH